METVANKTQRTCQIIAHRGASTLEPENTMAAFVAAGNRAYDGIETDLHVTSDGKYLLIHDDSTGRVAAGKDLKVEGNTFSLLRTVKLADTDGKIGRIDLRIPSLREYLNLCRRYEKTAVLELKNVISPAHIEGILTEVREEEMLEETIFLSFHLENLTALRERLPGQRLMLLSFLYTPLLEQTLVRYRIDPSIKHQTVTPKLVEEIHRLGLRIGVWTPDDPARQQELIAMGVDYLTTNHMV